MTVQAGLCRTWSETQIIGFLMQRLTIGMLWYHSRPMPEPSPLSSSILADWMEVTGNMNIDMDALEQELQSPMAFSYNDLNNDLNLYSS